MPPECENASSSGQTGSGRPMAKMTRFTHKRHAANRRQYCDRVSLAAQSVAPANRRTHSHARRPLHTIGCYSTRSRTTSKMTSLPSASFFFPKQIDQHILGGELALAQLGALECPPGVDGAAGIASKAHPAPAVFFGEAIPPLHADLIIGGWFGRGGPRRATLGISFNHGSDPWLESEPGRKLHLPPGSPI
jgi:hypothetical protein